MRTKAELTAELGRVEARLTQLTQDHAELCLRFLNMKADLEDSQRTADRWAQRVCVVEEVIAKIRRLAETYR